MEKKGVLVIFGIIILTLVLLFLMNSGSNQHSHEYCLEKCSIYSDNNQQYQQCYTDCSGFRSKHQDYESSEHLIEVS